MADTAVLSCNGGCANAYQDQKYGTGKRLHNMKGNKKSLTPEYRCTVCGTSRGK